MAPFHRNHDRGFTVLDSLLAMTILLILVTSFSAGTIDTYRSLTFQSTREEALIIAHEGMEAVTAMRDDDFSALTDGIYGLAFANGSWSFSGNSDVRSIYARDVTITTLPGEMKEVTVSVMWENGLEESQSLSLTKVFSNWRVTLPVPEPPPEEPQP